MIFNVIRKSEIAKIVLTILGGFVYAVGVNLFVVPHALYTGGLVGICQLIRTFLVEVLGLPFGGIDLSGILFFIINIPIFLMGYKYIGRRFIFRTAVTVVTMTVFLSLLVFPGEPIIKDTLTSSLTGAIVSGVGTGMVFVATSSGGGLDILAMMCLKKYKTMSFSKVNLAVNFVVYGICFFTFDFSVVVYSLIYTVFYSFVVDRMHQQNINVQTLVFTKGNVKRIEEDVFLQLGRGVTVWEGKGGFTDDKTNILCICLSKYEIPELKKIVYSSDSSAFFIEHDGVKVDGNFLKKL